MAIAIRSNSQISYPSLSAGAFTAALAVREPGPAGAPKPVLLDRVREAIRARHYSRRPEKAYVHWIKRYIFFFHGTRHPAEMGAPEVTAFLTALAVHDKGAACPRNQALSAVLVLYREVLGVELPWLDAVVRAKRPPRRPVVLTRDEVRAVLQRLDGVPRLMARLLYGAGLRVQACCSLRVKDIDVATTQSVIRDGTGRKDRATMLPAAVKTALIAHRARASNPTPTSATAPAGSSCPPPRRGRTRTPAGTGGGKGFSPPRACTWSVSPASVAVTTCMHPFSSAR